MVPNSYPFMIGIKKLDIYILKKFLLLFIAAFFICLFVFMMQFTWKYVEDLVGKGISMELMGQFFWNIALYLTPQALPMAVLLASLITFGNLGESFELLAMKAAGIPLIRIMRPLFLFALLTVGVSFYFQNKVSPKAYLDMRTMLLSLKQSSPAVEIPEGIFYSGVPNVNLYVQKKNAETGMLYQMIIYKTDQGFDRAQIVLADSGKMEISRDKMHLTLHMWSGEQFESLQGAGSQMMQSGAESPYDRETFDYKRFIIDFDSNFSMLDKNLLANMAEAMDMKHINLTVDSLSQAMDSVGRQYYRDACAMYYRQPALKGADSIRFYQTVKAHPEGFDSLMARMSADKQTAAMQTARSAVQNIQSDLEWKAMVTHDGDYTMRRDRAAWFTVWTLSLVCLLFFFVGAPLGAIIRKGGLGVPVIISVVVFIIRYLIEISTLKMARDGNINMIVGMWMSTVVILPLSVFLTYKANRDSGLFNIETYFNFMRRLLGIRTKRHIAGKEVIINEPRMDLMPQLVSELGEECRNYNKQKHLLRAPSYVQTFFHYTSDTEVEQINERMEALIEELSNSRDRKVLGVINEYPILYTSAHTSPFHSVRLNKMAGILFPLGIVLWVRIWRFRLRLYRDLRQTVRTCDRLLLVLEGRTSVGQDGEDSEDAAAEHAAREASALKRKRIKWAILAVVAALILGWGAQTGWTEWKRHRMGTAQPAQQAPADPSAVPDNGNALPQSGQPLRLPAQAPDLTRQK